MTVSSSTSRSGPYAGAGTTGPFPVTFRFLDNSHLLVVVTDALGAETTLVLNQGYTVTGVGSDAGGTLTLAAALLVGTSLTIQRNVPVTQLLDYTQGDSFPAESHESGLDKLTMIAQQQQNTLNGALRVPETASPLVVFPAAAARALKFAAFDSTGAPAVMSSLPAGSFTNGNAIMDTFVGDGVTLVFTLSQNPGSLANLSVSVGGVVQHNGDDFNWSTGTAITFEAPPPNGVPILARYTNAQALASATDSAITVQRAEAGAVPRTLQSYIRHSPLLVYNFCDPVNDSPAQTSANLATAIAAAMASGKALEFDPGATYTVDSVVNFLGVAGLKRLRFWGNGATIYRSSGAGPVATLDSGGDSSRCDEIEFLDFTLKGQALTTYGLDMRGVCRSRIRASAINVPTGFRVRWGVTTDHDFTLSSNVDAFAVIPTSGLVVTQTGSGLYPANCDFRVVMEAPITGIGVDYVFGALGNTFRGTCEGVGTGFRQRSTAGDCVLREMDFEANTVQDVLVEGRGLKFVDSECSSAGASPNFQIAATASDVTLRGGFARQVDIANGAAGTTINDLTVSDFVTLGITGSGAASWRGSGNAKVDTNRNITSLIPDQLGAVGSFACGLTGCTTVPASAVEYVFNGGVVTLNIPTMSATSNTTAATVTGMPAALRPAVARTFPIIVINNGANVAGMLTVETSGVMTLAVGVSSTGFTAALGKGLLTTSISYKV